MIEVAFEVTISTTLPLEQLAPETRLALQQLIDRARDAALDILAGALVAADCPPQEET